MEQIKDQKVFELFNEAGAQEVLDASIAQELKKQERALTDDLDNLALAFIANPSEKTFGPIYKRMRFGLRKFAYRYLSSLELADEMVLITFEKIWQKYDQFNPEIAKFSTWVYNILRYECLGYLNRKSGQNYVDNDINDLYASTAFNDGNNCEMPSENFEVIGNDIRMLSREEILMRVYDASIKEINMLPDNLKLIMTEKLIKNKKLEEVAAEQNIPVSSVKNWLRSGRLKIREKFKTDYKDLYELYLDVAGETGYLL